MINVHLLASAVLLFAGVTSWTSEQEFEPIPHAGAAHSMRMARLYGYGFDNWPDPVGSITFAHYAAAFYNVNPDSSAIENVFDLAIYNGIAANLSGGHCFAMSAMSIAMNTIGGYHGFCCPTAQYRRSSITETRVFPNGSLKTYDGGPADPELLEAMRVMQSHQLSQSTILTYVDQINSRVSRIGNRMLGFFEAAIANEGTALLNVTKSIQPLPGEGFMVAHSMIAYKVERTGLSEGRIYVVDPNRCIQYETGTDSISHHAWYKDGRNYIKINGASWQYYGSVEPGVAPDIWPTGARVNGDVSNGHLLCVPISRVGTAGVSLGSLGLAIGNITNGLRETLAMIFISGSKPHISQISTPDGRRVIDPETQMLEEDESKRVDRLVPLPLSMQAPQGKQPLDIRTAEVFAADRSYDTITVQAKTGADGATLTYMGRGAYASIETSTPNSEITVGFYDLSSSQPSLVVDSKDSHTMKITVVQRDSNDQIERKILESVAVMPGITRLTIPMQRSPAVSLQNE